MCGPESASCGDPFAEGGTHVSTFYRNFLEGRRWYRTATPAGHPANRQLAAPSLFVVSTSVGTIAEAESGPPDSASAVCAARNHRLGAGNYSL
jgi:hypothetical protein